MTANAFAFGWAADGGGSPPPAPPSTGLVHRYRSDTLTLSGGNVSAWPDLVGSNNLVQATGANQPSRLASWTNGKAGVAFDGSASYMRTSAFGGTLSPYTIVVVADTTDLVGSARILTDAVGVRSELLLDASGGRVFAQYAGGSELTTSTCPDSPTCIIGIFNGASSAVYYGATSEITGNPGSNGLDGLSVGCIEGSAAFFWQGRVGEILVYDHALDGTEQAAVTAYTTAYWGTP